MTRLIERKGAYALWSINGCEISLSAHRACTEAAVTKEIQKYCSTLQTKAYELDNTPLCRAFRFFGGKAFISIGMTLPAQFLDCFAFFAAQFASQWAQGVQCLQSKNIGVEYVFEQMLFDSAAPINYQFRYILGDRTDGQDFVQLVEEAFTQYWRPVVQEQMEAGISVADIARRVGDVRTVKYLMEIPDTAAYLRKVADSFTARRELISERQMTVCIFGKRCDINNIASAFVLLLKRTVSDVQDKQRRIFVAGNASEMSSGADIWRLYQHYGTGLRYLCVDFTQMQIPSMRRELKCYLRYRFSGSFRTTDRSHSFLIGAANRLCKRNANIRYFSDVDRADVKQLQAELEQETTQTNIMSIFAACRTLYDFLRSEENTSGVPKPYENPFESIRFVNAKQYYQSTPYIPEKVIEQIATHLEEMSDTEQLVFQILCETGMRAKEIGFLEADCLAPARYENNYCLRYVPYKPLKARRRNGLEDRHQVYISSELARKIQKQIAESAAIRQTAQLPYIFLHQHRGYKVSMLNVEYFSVKLNALIQKHHICDSGVTLWHFTSRQCRKTLVVNMIENGATVTELVYQLGHLASGTVMEYYAEVRAMKLAQLNSEFFQQQFSLLLAQEQGETFSEEERRQLFVDFRLGKRRVELGFCTRKLCDGACGSRSRTVHCVNCPQLCTGRQYLPHWERLAQSQRERVRDLETAYHAGGLLDYGEFAEYIQEQSLLLAYENVISQIEESRVMPL